MLMPNIGVNQTQYYMSQTKKNKNKIKHHPKKTKYFLSHLCNEGKLKIKGKLKI